MRRIKIYPVNVTDCRATYDVKTHGKLVCGNPFKIEFTFDEEWDGYDEKKAKIIFYHNGRYECLTIGFNGTVCPVPALYNIKSIEVGVFVEGDIQTTTGAVIECEKSINCGAPKSVLGADAIDNINKALKGKDGTNGLSAYQIAVNHGFEGSEEEWVKSLEGTDAVLTEADKAKMVQDVLNALPNLMEEEF